MSILEDLDLMDLLDELPEGSDFDLDDILSEFRTPGLFAMQEEDVKPASPVAEIEDVVEAPLPEAPAAPEEVLPEPVAEELPVIVEEAPAVIEEAEPAEAVETPAVSEAEDDDMVIVPDIAIGKAAEEEDAAYEHNENTLFGDSLGLCDILFEFGTPTDEEGVKLYKPDAKEAPAEDDEDDVKVYVPESSDAAVKEVPTQKTVEFDIPEIVEAMALEEAEAAAPVQAKAPGFFARAAAAVKGLLSSKKAAKPEVPAEEVPAKIPAEPIEEETPVELPAAQIEEETPGELPADLIGEELSAPEAVQNLPAEEIVFELSEPEASEEDVPVIDWLGLVEDAAEIPAAELSLTEVQEEPASEEEDAPIPEEHEDVAPEEAEVSSEEPAESEEDYDLHDILLELDASEEDAELLSALSVADSLDAAMEIEPAAEEDVHVYVPDSAPAAASADVLTGGTIVFDSVDLTAEPAAAEVSSTAEAPKKKSPGIFAKAAGLVMGLFASKKTAKPAAPAAPASVSEANAFTGLSDLFSEGELDQLDGLDALMLELELQAEREAELEAEAAARDAAERLAREEEQRALELEAQRLAQAEADAQAEAARQAAEEDARFKAETDALLMQLHSEIDTAKANIDFALQMPETEELSAPAYDYAAAELSPETAEYTAPQMDISLEDVPEEVGDLLEMPDVDQASDSEETPEEAAARKKKEEDNLHYKPEESAAKTVTSHIRNRFSAAFTAFTESDEDSDDEEALGPELPPNKAYRFFNKYINAYRFRLRISAVLCVILGWISLGLPVLGSLKNPAVAAAMCLMMLLTVMLAGADILAVGVRNLLCKRASIHSLVAISCVASVIDAIVIIVNKGVGGYLPFCAVSAISMCFAIYGSLLYCRSQRLNFKTLDRATEPMTISVDYGLVEEDTSSVYRSPGHPEGYIHHSEEEDLSETVFGIMAPIMIPAIPVMTIIAALFSNGFGDFFHILAAMFAAAASFGALIAFPLPYFLVQKELYATKAAIAGWAGAREIGRVSNMIVTDRDLFPDETVSIKSVRIVDNVPPQLTLSYMCSIIHRSESCLVPAFIQLAENNDCEIMDVENFQCHEAGGLSGEIGPDSVLVASHSYMKLQGFRIPARKKDSENALFLAVNGHVIAYIIVDYKPIKSVRAGLQSALRGNVEMIFAARDFNVTPLLISKKFKSATETLRFPSYSQRFEITSNSDSETAACAAVVYRKSFYSYAVVVEKAKYLYNSVSWGVILSVVSSVMGVLLMFIMALTGAGAAVTVGRLLVFMLLWLIPTLALTVSITK